MSLHSRTERSSRSSLNYFFIFFVFFFTLSIQGELFFISPAEAVIPRFIKIQTVINRDFKTERTIIFTPDPEIESYVRQEFAGKVSSISEEKSREKEKEWDAVDIIDPSNPSRKLRHYSIKVNDPEELQGVSLVVKELFFTDRYEYRDMFNAIQSTGEIAVYYILQTAFPVVTSNTGTLNRSGGNPTLVAELHEMRAQNMSGIYKYTAMPGNIRVVFEDPLWGETPFRLGVFLLGIFFMLYLARRTKKLFWLTYPLMLVFPALGIATLVVWLSGESPLACLGAIFLGSCVGQKEIMDSLLYATPVIFTGLAFALAFQSGLINAGLDGQILVSSFVVATLGWKLGFLPWWLLVPLLFLSAMFTGGLWAGLSGYLRARFQAHEIITSAFLNYIAIRTITFLFSSPILSPIFKEQGPVSATPSIADAARLSHFSADHPLNIGLLIAVITAFLTWFILYKTTVGFELRAVGLNPEAAETAGINVRYYRILGMFLSGLLASLCGTERIMGVSGHYSTEFFFNYGLEGIAASFMAGHRPILIIFTAFLLGTLKSGCLFMARVTEIPENLVFMINSIIIFLAILSPYMNKRGHRKS